MIAEITIRASGESVEVLLPRQMIERMQIGPGDRVFAIETDRGILLTPHNPEFASAMQAFDSVRVRYRDTLRRLAE